MRKKILIPIGIIALISASGLAYDAYAYQGNPAQRGPNFSPERHEAMQKAFENNDYNAWKNLMNGIGRVLDVINEGNFARFSEMHQLMLSGKYEEANQIREELGLGQKNGSGKNSNWQKNRSQRNKNCWRQN